MVIEIILGFFCDNDREADSIMVILDIIKMNLE